MKSQRATPPGANLLAALTLVISLASVGCHSFLRDQAIKLYDVQVEPDASLNRPNRYQADFLYLKTLAKEVIPLEDRYFPPAKRAASELEILERLGQPGCDNETFLLCVQAYLSGFNCQHAFVVDNRRPSTFSGYYPFSVHYVSNDLYLSNISVEQDESLIGQKIVSINGHPVPDVEQKLFVSGNSESLWTKRASLESSRAYSRPDLYQFTGLSASISNELKLEFTDHLPVSIAPSWNKNPRWKRDFHAPHPITARAPHQYDLRVFPEQNFAYLQFNACFDKTAIIDGLTMVRPWARPIVNAWLYWEFHRDKPHGILNGIYDPDRPVFKDYLASAITDLNGRGITNLILDLRHNSGGEGELTKQLLYHVTIRSDLRDLREFQYNAAVFKFYDASGYTKFHTWYKDKFGAEPPNNQLLPMEVKPFFDRTNDRKSPYFVSPTRPVYHGRVIVLVNQNTGSAAAILAGLMQDNHLAQIVGTTTGNNPTGPTGMTPFRLPHSGVIVSLPCEYDQRAEPLNGEVLQPDLWVEDSMDDLLNGRDAAFDKALDLLNVHEPTAGPLTKETIESAISYLKELKAAGRQPGWSKHDKGEASLESYSYFSPKSLTISLRIHGSSSRYHYTVVQRSSDGGWQLQLAWRTDKNGRTIERYSVAQNELSSRRSALR
jgi:hypothetical protein